MVEKTIFGTMEDGREVSRYTLTNQNGVSASFLDLGAIWSTMLVPDRNGEMADVLLGHETVADCLISDDIWARLLDEMQTGLAARNLN